MTPKEQAAMQQALDALEGVLKTGDTQVLDYTAPPAITSLREALAKQAEQEPVAYRVTAGCRVSDGMQVVFSNGEILYAAPVRTKDLTEEEAREVFRKNNCYISSALAWMIAKDIVAFDREKNK